MHHRLRLTLLTLSILTTSFSAHAQDAIRANAGGKVRTLPRHPLSSDDRARLEGSRGAEVASSIRGSVGAGLPKGASVRGQMSRVRDRGSRGTCGVFAAIALLGASTRLDLSEQCLAFQASSRDEGQVSERLGY